VSRVARRAVLALTLQVSGAALTYALYVALAHWSGTENFGRFSYSVAWATLLSTATGLGLPAAAVRFVPQLRSEGATGQLIGFVRLGRGSILCASVIAASAGTAAVALVGSEHFPGGLATAIPGFWLVPSAALILFESNVSRSFGKVSTAYAPLLVLRPLGIIVAAAILFYSTGRLTAPAALWSAFGAFTAVALIQAILVNRNVGSAAWREPVRYEARVWMRVSIALLLVTGFQVALAQTDVIIVGSLRGADDAGLYNAAAKTSVLVAYVLGAVEFVAAPLFATLLGSGRAVDLQRLVSVAAKWVFWPSLVVSIVLAAGAPVVLRLFGPDFQAARWPLTILLGAQLLNAGFGSAGYLLTLSGHQNAVARVYAATALVNVATCYAFTRAFGMVGAATSTACSIALWNVWLNVLTVRRLGVHPSFGYAFRRSRQASKPNGFAG
jgi:O-antigen/teichoic acid export membrane protein